MKLYFDQILGVCFMSVVLMCSACSLAIVMCEVQALGSVEYVRQAAP